MCAVIQLDDPGAARRQPQFGQLQRRGLAAQRGDLPAEGAELRQSMGVVLVGGLITSTMLTLLVVPVVYMEFEKWKADVSEDTEGLYNRLKEINDKEAGGAKATLVK